MQTFYEKSQVRRKARLAETALAGEVVLPVQFPNRFLDELKGLAGIAA